MSLTAAGSSAPVAAVLCGLAGWVPSRVVTNEDLARRLDTDDAWIRTRTGIRQRYVVEPGQATSDLAVEAGRRALASALASSGTDRVDAVVVATTTADHTCPATAPAVAARLGLAGVAAFDVNAVCTGFVYGLASAAGLIAAGVADRVLLIGADTYSTIVDPLDRANAIIFGDGAGAVVLRAGHPDEPGAVGHFDLGSDGAHEDLIMVAAGGSRQRSLPGAPSRQDRHFAMRGKEVYRHAVTRMAESARATLSRAGWKIDDVDHFVPHQANLRILHSVADDLGLPRERCVTHVESVGNTGAASIPLALADAAAGRTIGPGDRLLLTAFGGGLTWGSCLLTWPAFPEFPAFPAPARPAAQPTQPAQPARP
ncbi:3-oxoacyl-[acyl-carrier-protein] synthase-3 [Streptomyces aurantiacus]|uniref:beta-ketoacyl-ACP synthase III n=1 Tax=Streptomyces aurantiacus TaxID=47760 RepID=UPI00279450BC|nr:beta-ketoacyl-ACP synthase III [Streptomyces aurantiacus]MDQ0772262.1 3-oxoacyl-[acyl-carrier-protein] synthase-3 [Streptomyces aurantiacus]